VSLRQKNWAIIVDNFARALEKIHVSRDGRTVKMDFNEPLGDDDRRDLAAANKETFDKRVAVANVLEAIQQKRALPQDSLALLVGAPWAAYFTQAVAYDPKAPSAECVAAAKPLSNGKKPPPNPKCAPPVEPHEAQFGHKTQAG